jgi:transcriptional regulator with XRE-family HTH domain
MDRDNRLGEFLRARRELARPADVGLPDAGRRRVPGLRREEVAMLAGVSADYYIRLEQGRDKHPSDQVIEALARVFGLDEDAVAHLHLLARPAVARRRRAPVRPERAPASVLSLIEAWTQTPAVVVGRHLDILAHNRLAGALNPCCSTGQNNVRLMFLNPDVREFYPDWESVARDTVASLRASAGADLDHPRLTELVGELTLKSEHFARLWARHDVRAKVAGTKRMNHPLVGELTLAYETLAVNGSPGLNVVVYHATAGSTSAEALALLGSITAQATIPAPAVP